MTKKRATEISPLTTNGPKLGSLADRMDEEPWEFYGHLRDAGGPVWDEGMRAWLVGDYDSQSKLCQFSEDIFRFPFVLEIGERVPLGLDADDWLDFISHGSEFNLLVTTGEMHRRHRRWWLNALSAKRLEDWAEKWVIPIANQQIDRIIENGHADMCSEYSERVSPRVMAAALGLPHDEEWVNTVEEHNFHHINCNAAARAVRDISELPPGMMERGREATHALRQMMRPYVEERRSGEGDDFISLIWRDADELFGSDANQGAAITAWAIAAFMGGAETTAAAAGTGFHILLSEPGLLAAVRAGGREALNQFIEEGLRLGGPADLRARVAAVDTEFEGAEIKKGQTVIAPMFSANRDPRHYGCPVSVDMQRKPGRDHFAFAKGTRACPGNSLARLQLRTIYSTALERLQNLRLDSDAEPPSWQTRFVTRRLTPVNVLFEPAQPVGSRI